MKINNQASAEEILNGWKQALTSTIEKVGKENVVGVGFAMPGSFHYDKGIAMFDASVAKFENLYEVNVAEELAKLIDVDGALPFRFMNDASAFAVGEAKDAMKSVSITLGKGFGSAFIDNGVPVVEGEGIPKMGCVWHLTLKDGIGDDYFSTRWCIARWKELTGETVTGVKPIADAAATNEKAKAVLEEYGSNMGIFLGSWLKNFGAELLVMGGNVTGAYNLFGSAFDAELKKQGISIKIALSGLKEDAAIIGSARARR